MTNQQSTEQRLIDLETRIAFQEDAIQDLSDVLYRQQQQLDRLEQMCTLILQRMQDLPAAGGSNGGDERPPHY